MGSAGLEDTLVERWTTLLQEAWSYARGERANAIKGVRVSRYDKAGLHSYSLSWGAIQQIEETLPYLAELRRGGNGLAGCDPLSMRDEAGRQAELDYAEELLSRQEGRA